jgi:Flp pilus assembly protein TadG
VISLVKKFLRSRRSATAVALAIMTVPLLISASAAVDFSRIASARTLLQASADSAAIAGAGAWQTSQSNTDASNVTSAAYLGTGAQLPKFVTTGNPTVALACSSATAAICGGTANFSSGNVSRCPSGFEYCVVVSAQATLKNSLFAAIIPSEILSVTAIATTAFPPNTISQGDFTHTSIGLGSDLSGIYAYVLPEDGNGNPEDGNVPTPNSSCANSSKTNNGPIGDETNLSPVASTTPCNFLLIGLSTGGSGSGSLSFATSDPIGFTFVNFTGGSASSTDLDTTIYNTKTGASTLPSNLNTHNGTNTTVAYCEQNLDCTEYPSEIYVGGSGAVNGQNCVTGTNGANYCGAGYTVPAVPAVAFVAPTPTKPGIQGNSGSPATVLYGYCPAHNLYGSINAYPNATNNIVPVQDSINTFSSAEEVIGFPPTHATNHALIPFLGPVNTQTISQTITSLPNGAKSQQSKTYTVQAVCPQWPIPSNSTISARGSFSFTPTGFTTSDSEVVNVYSTYYPDATFTSNLYGNNIYPPAIAGCTPATNATDGGVTPTADDPWWGWSPSNANDFDPGNTSLHNCTFVHVSSAGTMTTAAQVTGSNGQSPPFTAAYDNCALLVQNLGQNASSLPNFWTYLASPTVFTGGTTGTGNPSGIISMTKGTGSVPTKVTIKSAGSGTFNGVSFTNSFTVSEQPGGGTTGNPPQDTSHQCYNPQANGKAQGTFENALGMTVNDNNNDTPIDPVENPQLGVVLCGSNPSNESYGLYWNDMGAFANPPLYNDDLGYSNAITEFTCPSPGSTSGGGPATLSG